MNSNLLLLLLVFLAAPATAAIYKWVDEDGQVHFSDQPPSADKIAEEVEVRINSYESVSYDSVEFFDPGRDKASVTMYSTSWCGYCKQARAYFQQNGIQFVEYDIEKNDYARQQYDALGGRGVPVIVVGDRRMNGFSPAGFAQIYNTKQAQP